MTLQAIHARCVALFNETRVGYQAWQHEPILNYETDTRVGRALGWTAEPTKSLFLRCKDGSHALLLTHRDSRLDAKRVKALLGQRVSVCADEEMQAVTGCLPGALCPFALPAHIPLLVDPALVALRSLMFTPGLPEQTFAFAAADLPALLAALPNPLYWLDEADATQG